jgi:putative component of membrane protein insertase Oxa1/YidC/SpoIIIJ protein YidD
MKFLIRTGLVFLFFLANLFAQTDWEKWDKIEIDYTLPNQTRNRNYDFEFDNTGEFILKSFANAYWFFISDVDGDNCPFRPSCSLFLIDAVKETNIFQGSLMFFDRFTRDLNIFKKGHYPKVLSGRYYDPVNLYTLFEERIHYIPENEIVTSE